MLEAEKLVMDFIGIDSVSKVTRTVGGSVEKLAHDVQGASGKLQGGIMGMAGPIGAVLGGLTAGLGAVGGAIIAFGLSAADKLTEAGHAAFLMSEKFGLLPHQASEWVAAGQQIGLGADSISTGFKFLAKNMEGLKLLNNAAQMHELNKELTAGSEAAKEAARQQLGLAEAGRPLQQAFDALGVKVFDVRGQLRPLNDVMMDAAGAFALLPDGADKAGLAMKLFGRSGADLIPLLDQGKSGLQALMKAADDAGTVLSDKDVKAAQQAYLAHKKLDMAFEGLTMKVGKLFLPMMERLVEWMTNTLVPKITEVIQSPGFAGFIGWLEVYVPAGIQVAMAWLKVLVINVKNMIEQVAGGVRLAHALLTRDWKEAWNAMGDIVKARTLGAAEANQAMADAMTTTAQLTGPKLAADWKKSADDIYATMQGLTPKAERATQTMADKVLRQLDRMETGGRNAGTSMGSGMIAGINAMSALVAAAAAASASNAAKAAKSAIKATSPSKIFFDIGQSMPQGMVLGIERGLPDVQRSMGRVVSPHQVTSSSVTTNNRRTLVIQPGAIVIQGGGDPQAIADAVWSKLAAQLT